MFAARQIPQCDVKATGCSRIKFIEQDLNGVVHTSQLHMDWSHEIAALPLSVTRHSKNQACIKVPA